MICHCDAVAVPTKVKTPIELLKLDEIPEGKEEGAINRSPAVYDWDI